MAVTYTRSNTFIDGFFDSTEYRVLENGLPQGNKARKAEFMAAYFHSFIDNGVFPNPSTNYQVSESLGMAVKIHAGKAWAKGYFCYDPFDSTAAFTTDTIPHDYYFVLRLDAGTGEINPIWYTDPNLSLMPERSPAIHELVIAEVSVPAGAESITNSMITDYRYSSSMCGIVAAAVENIDTDTIAQQINGYLTDLGNFITTQETEIIEWKLNAEQQFDDWFESVKAKLDENAVSKLERDKANRIYTVCATPEANTNKTAAYTGYTLEIGQYIAVKFINNVPVGSTLKIENTNALPIKSDGVTLVNNEILAGDTVLLIYNGVDYDLVNGKSYGGYRFDYNPVNDIVDFVHNGNNKNIIWRSEPTGLIYAKIGNYYIGRYNDTADGMFISKTIPQTLSSVMTFPNENAQPDGETTQGHNTPEIFKPTAATNYSAFSIYARTTYKKIGCLLDTKRYIPLSNRVGINVRMNSGAAAQHITYKFCIKDKRSGSAVSAIETYEPTNAMITHSMEFMVNNLRDLFSHLYFEIEWIQKTDPGINSITIYAIDYIFYDVYDTAETALTIYDGVGVDNKIINGSYQNDVIYTPTPFIAKKTEMVMISANHSRAGDSVSFYGSDKKYSLFPANAATTAGKKYTLMYSPERTRPDRPDGTFYILNSDPPTISTTSMQMQLDNLYDALGV